MELNSSAVESFVETVQNGAAEAAAAFERTFQETITVRSGESGPYQVEAVSKIIAGKGLALLLQTGEHGIAILIPSSSGLVPSWCDDPDATGKSKLSTFAQEWGMNLVPDDFFPEDFHAAVVDDLPASLLRAQMALDGGCVELIVTKADGTETPVAMLWPLAAPQKLLEQEPKEPEPEPIPGLPTFGAPPGEDPTAPAFIGDGAPGFDPFANQEFQGPQQKRPSLDDLPGYSRSVLKVKVPVAAVLATARKPIKTILELGVGSVIQFDKSCDELLDVEIGQSVVIGTAEAVKVGDKFGFRINTILLPDERFRKVDVRREGEYRVKHDSPQIIGKAPINSLDKR